jgi:SWI/SNF-related matrix-associated actin-dependent regulator 1 of chromatin subfamily A
LERGEKGPHLVVVPGSTLENWLRECRRFCPALAVEPYYGEQLSSAHTAIPRDCNNKVAGLEKERAEIRLQLESNIEHINVIITTYDIAAKKADGKFLRHLKPTVSRSLRDSATRC